MTGMIGKGRFFVPWVHNYVAEVQKAETVVRYLGVTASS